MGSFVKRRAFIPVAEAPAEMPEGIEARYYTHKYGKFKEITQDNVKRIMKNLRSGRWESIFLSEEADEEGDYMQLESGGGLYALQYVKDLGQVWWSTYDSDYLDTYEETDIDCSDGQSIVFREFTTADKEAVQSAANEKAYQRLAELKSRQAQLTSEREALAAKGDPPLTAAHLAKVIELWTKIPATSIQEQEFERLAKLDQRLKEHIVGQDDAVNAVSNAIRRGRVGIAAKHKPVSFIFVGSTGVGKTELVKRLAADLFSSPESLIRLDMSEFMEKHSVSRIIGSPPGYVGYDDAGQLTEKIRRKPYTVVLFDEIEKAHPDVLNVLLQILDDGHISDAHGKVVNFENTVIVMTSNAGSDVKGGSLGFDRSANQLGKEKAMKGLESFLRPEFINRVDEIVYFNQLTEDNFKDIARIMLSELDGVLKEKNIAFSYDESVLDYLVKKSYSAAYGARNLRRQIQKDLEDPIAAKLIQRYADPVTRIGLSAQGETLDIAID